jgi:hypothetical protein
LLRPALLSSGTDVSFLDRTLLEKDIAAVFNKVSHSWNMLPCGQTLHLYPIMLAPVSMVAIGRGCNIIANYKYTVGLQRRCNIAYFCHFFGRELHTSCQ